MAGLYSLGVGLYHTAVATAAALGHGKARAWVVGRRGLWKRLDERASVLSGALWMHCASAGEFEQGRPIIEALKRERPNLPVLVTFYSPSGYEAYKHLPLATHVDYLPADTPANARRLQQLVRPCAALFVKYEFWHHHLHALDQAHVRTYLVSGIFRAAQPFFRWFGGTHRRMLACFDHLFVQDPASKELLSRIGLHHVTVSGDTRFDRVSAVVTRNEELETAQRFRHAHTSPVLVAGSTWPKDEELIRSVLTEHHELRAIIAPHELDTEHLRSLAAAFPPPVASWSHMVGDASRTLLVDQVGLLSRLYKYADVAYIGGGFGSGIHNTLEAAAWGKPVIFGPNHARFAEANGLIAAGGGFAVANATEARDVLRHLLGNPEARKKAGAAAARYVQQGCGATGRILQHLLPTLPT
jgi:3-deoxy-D-manno-octulosonic-acid transferase